MTQILTLLKSRRTVIPLACAVGSVGGAVSLFYSGAIDAKQAAALVFALYIGSKVFMAGAALWMAVRHSEKVKAFVMRRLGLNPATAA